MAGELHMAMIMIKSDKKAWNIALSGGSGNDAAVQRTIDRFGATEIDKRKFAAPLDVANSGRDEGDVIVAIVSWYTQH